MKLEMKVPSPGESITEVEIAQWLVEDGDYVICAVSGKKIDLDKLTYWNVQLQEPYFSYIEAFQKREARDKK